VRGAPPTKTAPAFTGSAQNCPSPCRGHREPGETNTQTLLREIDEELQSTIDPESMIHFGTYETHTGRPERPIFRMICYTADYQGPLTPSQEIAEKAWFTYVQRNQVSRADQLVFDALHEAGQLP